MRKLPLFIFALFSSSLLGGEGSRDLGEFSTSMDFEEFQVVLMYLESENQAFGLEMSEKIKKFRVSSKVGQSQKTYFKSKAGYMVLEREDDYAFGIATYTTEEIYKKLESACAMATNELGI